MLARVTCCATVSAALLVAPAPALTAPACQGTLYLTLFTSNMSQAENVAGILARHDVKATFFLANEKTVRGDYSLDPGWGEYWRARVAEGHAFGSHTWDHGSFRGDVEGGRVRYVRGGKTSVLDADGVCAELKRVDTRFRELTGRALDPVWSAPGGHTTANALAAARRCGFEHVRWTPAGALGDELPSDRHPNERLLQRALKNLRDGDVMMMHLGIRSRQEPFAPMLDPLLAGLKARGFCFTTIEKAPERLTVRGGGKEKTRLAPGLEEQPPRIPGSIQNRIIPLILKSFRSTRPVPWMPFEP